MNVAILTTSMVISPHNVRVIHRSSNFVHDYRHNVKGTGSIAWLVSRFRTILAVLGVMSQITNHVITTSLFHW